MSEVIGREWRTVKRDLEDSEQEGRLERARQTYTDQKRAQSQFAAFKKYAEPLVRATLDPSYSADEEIDEVAPEEARALTDELDRRRKHTAATVAKLKADRRVHLDAAANGYFYDVVECELQLDDSGTQVRFIDPTTGEVVGQRAATAAERQMALPADELPDAKANGKSKGRRSAPGAVQ